ncbi:glycoside hydrolase family protein [Ottowia sp. VDI28]|uniref:glycoside hydrolase family protein n=1 Tax=Ottowia sp. VDI28 TaxID=3133968 RepID=UPI003C2B762C
MPARILVVSITAGLAWMGVEGFSSPPYIPTKGDVPTIGYGSTHYEDGTRVTMTDPPISRERAKDLALGELERTYGQCVRDSLGDTLVSQAEFDIAVDFAGQYGCGAFNASSIRAKTVAGDYVGACKAYLAYKLMNAGRQGPGPGLVLVKGAWKQDCSYPGNKVCMGSWTRQLKRYEDCMAAQPMPETPDAPPAVVAEPSVTPEISVSAPAPAPAPWWRRALDFLMFWRR